MTRMKDSGIEWIGEVPEEWGIVRLKDCLEINNGKDYKDIETDETGYPVIGSGGQFAYARKYLHDGTAILLGRKGTIDKPLYIEGKFWTVDTMFYSVPKSGIHAKFIYYVALQIPFGLYSTNTALPSMTQTDLQNHHFVMPPLDEQTQIADFLDKKVAQLDKVKSLLEEQIKTLEDYRQSLIYETVTKGLDKTVPLKESGIDWIGQIPEGWTVDRLGFHIYEINEKNIPQKSDFILSLTNKDGVIPYEEKGNQGNNSKDNLLDYKLAYPDTIVANSMNILIGSVGYSNYFGCISPVYYVFKERKGTNLRFVNYIMATQLFQKELRKYANGILEIRLRVSSEDILKRFCAFPSLSDQDKIVSYLDKRTNQINQMIAIKKEQIENINKQRQTLIYDYVTGKRRV